MQKKYIVVSLLVVSVCSMFFIANSANKSMATNDTNNSSVKKNVEINDGRNKVKDRTEIDGKSKEKLEYEDDEFIITSREKTFQSEDEHREFIKKLQEEKESRPKIDDNILIEED